MNITVVARQTQTSGMWKYQKRIFGIMESRIMNARWFYFLFLIGCLTQTVFAAGNGSIPSTSTVRPIPTKGRLPFLSSINPRRAAKEAYLLHLQNELESAQRQLYVSQNTCNSLRKRWEEQRIDTLTTRSRDAVPDRKEEIDRLQQQLQRETEIHQQQVEHFNLLSSEMNELKVWKETHEASNKGKILEYEQMLQESNKKQSDYAEQVELLALKLEAASIAAKARHSGDEEVVAGGKSNTIYARRAQELRSELDSIRVNYSTMLINSLSESADQGEEGNNERRKQRESEMDNAIQSAFESALESFENEWAARYEALENQMNNMTAYARTLEAERDAALNSQVQGTKSSKVAKSEQKLSGASLSESQTQQLREELTAQLTDALTIELTEQLTKQLTSTLVDNIEKTYKKKMKQLHKDIKEQRKKVSELQQSQKEMTLQQQQSLEAEIDKIKRQYQLDYESKMQQLQKESEEQTQAQKERMRKLVRALLEREAMQKKGEETVEATESTDLLPKRRSSSKRKKIKDNNAATGGGPSTDGGGGEGVDPNDEMVPVSASRSRKRSAPPGIVPPVRGSGNR